MSQDPADVCADSGRIAFEALVRDRMNAPFKWGEHDCCLFAADAVLAMTGRDPAAAERGTYDSAAGALQLLAELGGLAAVAARAGEPITPLQATVGDVGLVNVNGTDLLAVCSGLNWLAPGGTGLVALDLQEAQQAWRVSRG